MEITEDSLFEVLDSESRNDEIGKVYTAKELAGQYIDYKLDYENNDDIDNTIIEEINKELDEGNYSIVKEGRLEEILDYKLTKTGEVEEKIKKFKDKALELLEYMEYDVEIDKNTGKINLIDLQCGYLGGEDSYKGFNSIGMALDRLESHFDDYIHDPLDERLASGEKIADDDWDLEIERLLESDNFWDLLNTEYANKLIYERFDSGERECIHQELGVLLQKNDPDFASYNNVYDKKYAYYDENQTVLVKGNLKDSIDEVCEYVANGVENTYGVVSFQGIFNAKANEINARGELEYWDTSCIDYDKNNIIYSVAKINGELVQDFITPKENLNNRSEELKVYIRELTDFSKKPKHNPVASSKQVACGDVGHTQVQDRQK